MPATELLTLDSKYAWKAGTVYMTGVQALVRLPLEQAAADRRAGMKTGGLVTGYQGSPLAGFDLELGRNAERLREAGIRHQPALNEELAATAVMGSQLVSQLPDARHEGVVGYWYGKAPGLDRAGDAIRHANLIGVEPEGGAIAIVGDDAMSKSSTVPSSSESALFDFLVPFLSPADPQEVLDLGLHAVALSRASGLWAGLKIATNVADGSGSVELGADRIDPWMPTVELDGKPYRHQPTSRLVGPVMLELERSQHAARLEAARLYGVGNHLNRTEYAGDDDRIGIVAAGKTYLDLLQALAAYGLTGAELERSPLRLLKVAMPFPLDPGVVRDFAAGLDEVVVVEEKRAFLELFVKDALYAGTERPPVHGKRDADGSRLVPPERELDSSLIAGVLESRLAEFGLGRAAAIELPVRPGAGGSTSVLASGALPPRTPWFCSGCPHNSSTVVPEDTLVGAGIGCHGMVLLMPEERVGKVSGLTQMGGEGAQWIGMAPFTERGHFVQNVGDGTFFHSGSLGVRAAVAAGVNITFKILFNSAVAMTGGQEAVGGGGVAELTRLLAAEGVARTIVTSDDVGRLRRAELAPNARLEPRSRMLEAQEELAATPGVTVLIHEQECAAELRRKRKRGKATDPAQRVLINERVCEGCGDCGRKSNCLSVQPVETEFGPKTRIHQASCNKDFSCLEGDCPSFLTITGVTAVRKPGEVVAELPPDTIPEPASSVEAPASVRIVGVGGTGVVTVAQVLGTAALIDGFTVRGLDQTGLAQKGGTVVSDLRIFSGPAAEGNKISDGGADLYLGCDLLASVAPQNLRAASPQRTRAVVSTTDVPTGAMVSGAAQPFPDEGRGRDAIDSATRTGNRYLDSQALARRLFGGDQTANVLLLGVAYQDGSIPVSAAAIEQAIELNGASVQQNIQAFRRGRQWAHDPNALEAVAAGRGPDGEQRLSPADQELAASVGATPGGELERVLQIRVPDLVAYQSRAYARRYCELVGRTRVAEHDAVDSEELTAAVAIGLHKLMTYKDEYEVARLHLDAGFRAQVERDFGPGARVQWNLHPPVLRSLGMRGKWRVGRWFAGVFHLLRAMRKLRFTPIDPFGWAHVRRVERDLIDEYRRVVEMLLEVLAPDTHGRCVEIAALPDMVRGYESIKLENVARYHARLGELCHVLAEESGSDAPKEVIDRG